MADPFIGEVRTFGFAFVPQGWLFCDGGTYPIQQYQALYAVIGNTYGGTAGQTFGVPDLRGDAVGGAGTGTGLSPYTLNQLLGTSTVTLSQSQMPAHSHQPYVWKPTSAPTLVAAPAANSYPTSIFTTANGTSFSAIPEFLSTSNASLATQAVSAYGTSGPHDNTQPYLAVNFCVCCEGVFPIRP